MDSVAEIVRGLALTCFALGGLLIAIGSAQRGRRCLIVAVALVLCEPLFVAGVSKLRGVRAPQGIDLDRIILGLFVAAVVIAGLVALRRSRRDTGSAATSPKKRVERAP